jgi:hypothetical protein
VTGSTRPQLVTCSWSAYRREMGAYVRISLGVPRVKLPDPRYTERRHYVYVSELAPRREYFHAPADEFARRYVDQLRLYADDIDRKLAAIPPEHGAICLLCWERRITGPECHRRLAARFLADRYGVEVAEMDAAPGGCR